VELERLSVQLRPRGGWEALDLGFQMARSWWRPVWGVWLAVYLPAAVALHVVFQERPFFAVIALWWLKPVFDRFVLHVVSRAVFGAPPTVRDALAAWRDILQPGLLPGLIWVQRLSPWRSFTLPVWQLEKQTGRAAHERREALGRRMAGYGGWLTLISATFEGIVLVSALLLVTLLAPAASSPGFEFSTLFRGGAEDGAGWDLYDSLAYVAAVSIVEPVYVASGFSLYLNRRAILEGWDIELALRRLDERLRGLRATVAAVLAAIVCFGALPPPASAAEKSAKAEIKEVLKAPEFQTSKEAMTWRYRGERKAEKADRPVSDFWENVGAFLAQVSQALLWIAVAAGVVALFFFLRRYLPQYFADDPDRYRPPDALFGLAVTPESLPDDVAGTAARLAREGRLRDALSLLYRGALSVLVHRDHVPLAEGDTEGDCLRAAHRALPREGADYFGRLVRAWQSAAYAGRLPGVPEIEALANEWAPVFAAQPEPSAPAT
jgi:hypothetical protein